MESEKNQTENTVEHDDNSAAPEQETACHELETCKKELASLKDAYMRLQADFKNKERHMAQERSQWARIAQVEVLSKLLPVVDNFERALAEKEKEELSPELESWFEGFKLIGKDFGKYLEAVEIKPVELGDFNPEFHEAVFSVEASDKESGAIVDVIEKGYSFKDHVLRPAKVSVAK